MRDLLKDAAVICWQLTLVLGLVCLVLEEIHAGPTPVVITAVLAGVGALISAVVNVLAMTVKDRSP